MRAAHSRVYRGKRVLIRLKDGTKFVDRYVDNTRSTIILEGRRLAREDIKSMSIYREPRVTWVTRHYDDRISEVMARTFPNQCPVTDSRGVMLCGRPLTDGACAVHGKVKFTAYEKEEEDKQVPALSRMPPPKRAGKIMPKNRVRQRRIVYKR